MDPQDRKLLEETAKLAKENHKILKKMHRQNVLGSVVRTLRFIVVVGIAIWAYYISLPIIEQLQTTLQNLQSAQDSILELKNVTDDLSLPEVPDVDFSGLQNLLDAFTINGQ